MRILFTTWAQTGHYQPLVPLGWAFRAAGHDVLVATHPGFVPTITGSGLPAVGLGPDIDVTAELRRRYSALPPEVFASTTFERPAGAAPPGTRMRDLPQNLYGREMMRCVLDGCAAMLDDALELAASWRPDLVVFEPTGFVGPLVAAVHRLPTARHLWGPDLSRPMQALSARIFAPLLARLRLNDLDITGTVTLDPCPSRLQVAGTLRRQPIRYLGYHGPIGPPSWLLAPVSRPRICVTWGTSIHGIGLPYSDLPSRVVGALSTLDADVVVAAPRSMRDALGDLPPNVVQFGPVPLRALLPGCDVVVHQGGSGTTMSSVLSGVPQLVIPTTPDAMFLATQVAASGAGVHLSEVEADTASIRGRVEDLRTDPGYRTAATGLRDEAQALPTPAEVVGVLESIVDG